MTILITGAKGQLGTELSRQLAVGNSALGPIPAAFVGAEVVGADMAEADLTKLAEARALVRAHSPAVVLHCAAFTNVDACESQRDAAFAANAVAARNVAIACEEVGAHLVHVSTDYVLTGEGDSPLDETAPTGPQSVYGATKLLGERYVAGFCTRHSIVRTAWLYGGQGGNFVKTILRIAREKGALSVVDDQVGTPTCAEDLAHHLLRLAAAGEYGLFHCTGNGVCSWYEFAVEIVRLAGVQATVKPCTTAKFPRPAKRPAYSALDNAMLRATIGDGMRGWQEALADYMTKYSLEELLS